MGITDGIREFGWGRAIGLVLLGVVAIAYGLILNNLIQEQKRITTVVEGTPGEEGKPGKPGVGITNVTVRTLPPGEQPFATRLQGGLLVLHLPRAAPGATGATGPQGPRGFAGKDGEDGKTIRGPRGFKGRPGESKGLNRGEIIQIVDHRIQIRLNSLTLTCHRTRGGKGNQFICRVSNARR